MPVDLQLIFPISKCVKTQRQWDIEQQQQKLVHKEKFETQLKSINWKTSTILLNSYLWMTNNKDTLLTFPLSQHVTVCYCSSQLSFRPTDERTTPDDDLAISKTSFTKRIFLCFLFLFRRSFFARSN